ASEEPAQNTRNKLAARMAVAFLILGRSLFMFEGPKSLRTYGVARGAKGCTSREPKPFVWQEWLSLSLIRAQTNDGFNSEVLHLPPKLMRAPGTGNLLKIWLEDAAAVAG